MNEEDVAARSCIYGRAASCNPHYWRSSCHNCSFGGIEDCGGEEPDEGENRLTKYGNLSAYGLHYRTSSIDSVGPKLLREKSLH